MLSNVYTIVLLISGVLMLFMGFYLIVGGVPESKSYCQYLRSRRIIGFSFVVLAIQIFVQMLFDFRSNNPSLASTINLTAYYLIAILSTASYISLIDNHYLTRNRVQRFIVRYSLFLFFLWVSYFMIPNPYRQAFIWIAALFFFLEVCHLAWQFFNTYQDVVRKVENYYYDNVDVFVRWLYKSVYGVVFCGAIGAVLAFAPKWTVVIYIVVALLAFIYIFISFQNYMIHFEVINIAVMNHEDIDHSESLESSSDIINKDLAVVNRETNKVSESSVSLNVSNQLQDAVELWIASKGYLQNGITLGSLSEELLTNRTYLSSFINSTYKCSFRSWINQLRIEHSKKLLLDHNNWTIEQISQEVGYTSNSHYVRLFAERESVTPSEWRKQQSIGA